jgi:hypothetical protein
MGTAGRWKILPVLHRSNMYTQKIVYPDFIIHTGIVSIHRGVLRSFCIIVVDLRATNHA